MSLLLRTGLAFAGCLLVLRLLGLAPPMPGDAHPPFSVARF
ncbi:hypothetical protein [Roseomonas sp. GC11]|nr:hypothetical protein [Roseomonas sp. GC11]